MNVSRICLFLMAISTVLMPPGFSQERAGPVVNLMIDVDTPSVPTNEEVRTLGSIFIKCIRRSGPGIKLPQSS